MSEKNYIKHGKVFSLEKLGSNEKIANFMLDPLFSQKTKCALTPKLVSHSPKAKWHK